MLYFLNRIDSFDKKIDKIKNKKEIFFFLVVHLQWYHKLKGNSDEEPADVTEIKGNSRLIYKAETAETMDQDAEWIPF